MGDPTFEALEAQRVASLRAQQTKESDLKYAPLRIVEELQGIKQAIQTLNETLKRLVDVSEPRK